MAGIGFTKLIELTLSIEFNNKFQFKCDIIILKKLQDDFNTYKQYSASQITKSNMFSGDVQSNSDRR